MAEAIIRAEHISKKFKNKTVLEDISFEVMRGEFLSLLGPSGCGKTTILRMLIGIEQPTSGRIIKIGGDDKSGSGEVDITHMPPKKRNIGIVFQNYSLFPNMDVYHNIAYALKSRYRMGDEIDRAVRKMISTVGLEEHIYKKPRQLSGGQQQRVAIARAIAMGPEIIYFDEPTSALDPELIGEVLAVMRKLAEEGMTMLVVTHEMDFARNVSSKVMFMEHGKVIETAPSKQFFEQPAEERAREFIRTILEGRK